MPLSRALTLTLLIFIAVWSATYFATLDHRQSVNDHQYHSSITESAAGGKVSIIGIRDAVNLGEGTDEVNALWQKFYGMTGLHMTLNSQQLSRVYGHYRFDRSDPNLVTLIIGYDSHGQSIESYPILKTIDQSGYSLISESTVSWDTTAAWSEIDYSRAPQSVLEEYEMNSNGDVVATRVFVNYRENSEQ